jgi:hypothetical protein
MKMRQSREVVIVAAMMLTCGVSPTRAEDAAAPPTYYFALPGVYHEIESKYIFGFTDGSDIGAEGETALESDTNAAFRRRHGNYTAVEQEVEFEHVPTQFFAYELSLHSLGNSIKNDDEFADRRRIAFSGFSAHLRYLLLGRGPESPVGLTITAEPGWARASGEDGTAETSFSSTFKILADTELIENRLFLAGNLIWQPEFWRAPADVKWLRASGMGATTALAWRISPTVTIGGELEYYRANYSLGFNSYQGNALFLGPTLHVQFTKKIKLAGAFSAQVAGHAVGDPMRLDLSNFSRYRARLLLEVEF